MHKNDLNRVEYFSKEDMAGGYHLSKGEHILRNETKSVYEDFNDILELYNIKQYLDNELFLKNWTQNDIKDFKQKAIEYGKIVGQFMSKINDNNVISYYEQIFHGYINSFWELVNNQKLYKQISSGNLEAILSKNPHQIRIILTYKNLVNHYHVFLRDFLLKYPLSAEVLLSIYEVKDVFNRNREWHLPHNLTVQDKEEIILNYIDNEESNLNYLRLITIVKNKINFKLSDKTRLKAKQKEKQSTDKLYEDYKNVSFQRFGVSISFPENPDKIKELHTEDNVAHYSYSLNYIKQNKDAYFLFLNFKILFEFLDHQNRIEFVNKTSQLDVMERVMGIHSESEYRMGIVFNMNEITSYLQIYAYCSIINGLEISLENTLQTVFTKIFQAKYNFANNARLTMPSSSVSSFEKVRFLAPEFESILKQFKLFVEDGEIDFELLKMSSTPTTIGDIPSLNEYKYIYFKEDNQELVTCSNLFFSDQTSLAYVEPFEDKNYNNLFDLLANEEVKFDSYKDYQKLQLNYLINKKFLYLDQNGFVQFKNIPRLLILKDLNDNEVASYYHYEKTFQEEAKKMKVENIVVFESSLFSKPEHSFFNYYLNKK